MASIKDDRGYNQGFKPSRTLEIRTKRRYEYILSKITANKKNDILEIGCGLGDISFHLAKHENNKVLGIDLCVPFIEEAKKNYNLPNLAYMTLDFNHPENIENRKFDYIIGNGILHHLYYELDNALINFKCLLKEHGEIIFLEPNLYNPYCYIIFNTTDFFRNWAKLEPSEMAFSKTFIKKKMIKAGFSNIDVKNKDFLIPGIPYLLVRPIIILGNIIENIPVLKLLSQSIFITAKKGC